MSSVDTNWPPPDIFPLGRLRPDIDVSQRFWADFWSWELDLGFGPPQFDQIRVPYPDKGSVQAAYDDGFLRFEVRPQGTAGYFVLHLGGTEQANGDYGALYRLEIGVDPRWKWGPGPFFAEGAWSMSKRDFHRRFDINVPGSIEIEPGQRCGGFGYVIRMSGLNTNADHPMNSISNQFHSCHDE